MLTADIFSSGKGMERTATFVGNVAFEENDQAALFPEKVKALENKWNRWAEEKHVFPFEYRPWGERVKYYKSLYPNQSGKE